MHMGRLGAGSFSQQVNLVSVCVCVFVCACLCACVCACVCAYMCTCVLASYPQESLGTRLASVCVSCTRFRYHLISARIDSRRREWTGNVHTFN